MSESGLAGFDIATWFGLMAPAGTPPDVIAKVHADVARIMATPEFRKQLAGMGAEPVGNTPAQMDAQIRAEVQKFEALARKAKLSID